MKNLLIKLLMAVIILLADTAWAAQAEFVNLTIESNPAAAQSISWRSDSLDDSFVEYKDSNGKNYRCLPQKKSYIIEGKAIYFYTARLTELEAGQVYTYAVKAGNTELAGGSFRTADNTDRVKFLLFGDSQSVDYGIWQNTLQQAVQAQAGQPAFIVNDGDLVDNGNKYSEWQGWFRGGEGVFNQLNIVPVVGNHETFAADYAVTYGFTMPELFTEQFALPDNGPPELKEQVYSFDYNNLHIAVLDSQFSEERAFVPEAWQQQLAWLAQDLAVSSKPWKIVFMHKPIYHNRSDIVGAESRFSGLAEVLKTGGVDIVFTGHDHVLAKTAKIDGVVYMATGRSGTKTSPKMEAKEWNDWFFNPLAEPVYSVVNIDGAICRIEIFNANNEQLYSWELDKRVD